MMKNKIIKEIKKEVAGTNQQTIRKLIRTRNTIVGSFILLIFALILTASILAIYYGTTAVNLRYAAPNNSSSSTNLTDYQQGYSDGLLSYNNEIVKGIINYGHYQGQVFANNQSAYIRCEALK